MKRLAAIQKAATWQERHKLAENEEPGTPFDRLFADAMFALKMVKTSLAMTQMALDFLQHSKARANCGLSQRAPDSTSENGHVVLRLGSVLM